MGKKPYLLTVVLAVVAGFAGGVGSSWFLMGSPVFAQKTPESAKVIQAEKFVVVDTDGKPRAALAVVNGEPVLALIDKDEKPRAVLSLSHGEPGLVLYDENGKCRTALSLSHGEPFLTFADKNEKPHVGLTLNNDGEPLLQLADKNGKVIWGVP